MSRRIALVEDEPLIRSNYSEALKKHGFQVEAYADRKSALERFNVQLPDLVIIDVGLGSEIEGGFELCREVRAKSAEVPIIFLTARDSELDQISGLRLGADDYLTKDISLPYLITRIVALFRRLDVMQAQQNRPDELITRGKLVLNLDRMHATWSEQPLNLTVTEFWIVHALARHPGHVKNRDQLMDAANTVLDNSTVTSHIKRIRKKFQALDQEFDCIQTAYGMGYRWHLVE
ncbi:proteobacterial dedicated sortase system response regulator [Hahella sp. CCB-MM4]|uniref:proteobacterial dedicated sortase system response regulator n=1 Tax=Hahella sp. (strain CCB-MM4) TaxID=1926491 RepID=UPI000B9C5A65|nr:proteobacterial dedicated sortase system response regulator [Hahella sp. CCB-MM4]OZG71035.1 proteobacterial dedicated sortase system response regulator [Hahella sp. CCB-MM4]